MAPASTGGANARRGATDNTAILSLDELRRMIAVAKSTGIPSVPAYLADYLVGAYVEMRKEARVNREMTYTSAR